MKTGIPREILEGQLGKFSPEEIAALENLFRPFCHTAVVYLANFCQAARKHKDYAWEKMVGAIQHQFDAVWSKNPEDRIGDPDDINHGLKNAEALLRLYLLVGFSNIPKGLY